MYRRQERSTEDRREETLTRTKMYMPEKKMCFIKSILVK